MLDFIHNDLGLTPEESIPGLAIALVVEALSTEAPHQALDEAVKLLEIVEEDE